MDHFAISIHERMSKVENSLLDLNKEILISLKYLLCLKKNSTEIITNLNSITTPVNYLKEFMDVNSFILNYLSFLTEINCKFEMLEMSQKTFINSLSITKAITSEVMPKDIDKSDLNFSCDSLLDLKTIESGTDSKKVAFEQPSESESSHNMKPSKRKKSERKKSKNCKKIQCNNKKSTKNNNNNNNNVNNNSNKSNKNNKIIDKSYNSDKNKHTTEADKKNDSDSKCNSINFSKKEISFEMKKDVMCCNNLDEKKRNCFSHKVSDSKTVLPSKNFLNDINVNEVKQTSSTNESDNTSLYSTSKSISDKVVFSEIQTSLVKIPMAGILSSKINEQKFDSEISKYYNCTSSSKDESLKVIEFIKSEVKINENEDDIKPANILRKLGEEYDVTIEHIQSPSEFYISIINDESNLLNELEKKLKIIPDNKIQTFSKNIKDKKAWLCKEIGNYALFYSKCDEIWCRVKIINWCLNFKDDFVNVFLLDYGESKCVSVDDLQPMPESFKKYPAFTQRCHLFNVFPLDMDKNIKTLFWEKESSEIMKSLTENSKMIKIKVAPDDCYHPFNSLPVTLWLVDQGNQCVNELLVKRKYAIQRSVFDHLTPESKITVEESENLKNWNPMKEDFESYQNLYDLDINDPATFIYGYVGKDYERICPHFAKTGYCFKGRACRKEHQKLDPLGFTTDKEEIYKNSFKTLSVPPPNTVLNVQVTCILAFNQFCCISKDQTLSHSDEEDLQSLLKFMNNAENVREMKKLLIPPSVGQIVIAQYSEDHSWYRSRVLESEPEKDIYTVIFVDYGNKETLHLSEIRAIEARYLHLPFQAMRCHIFGIDRNPEVPLKDVMDYLNKRMDDGHISIEIVTRLPGDDVNLLVRVFDHNGRNIGEDLIANKYLVFKEEMIISSDSLSMPG